VSKLDIKIDALNGELGLLLLDGTFGVNGLCNISIDAAEVFCCMF
jgi:hypothetical protein